MWGQRTRKDRSTQTSAMLISPTIIIIVFFILLLYILKVFCHPIKTNLIFFFFFLYILIKNLKKCWRIVKLVFLCI